MKRVYAACVIDLMVSNAYVATVSCGSDDTAPSPGVKVDSGTPGDTTVTEGGTDTGTPGETSTTDTGTPSDTPSDGVKVPTCPTTPKEGKLVDLQTPGASAIVKGQGMKLTGVVA